jgi:hypothetical protein
VSGKTTEKALMSLVALLNHVVQAYVTDLAQIGLWVFAAIQLVLTLETFAKVRLLKLPLASKDAEPMPLVFISIYAVLRLLSATDLSGKLWAASIILVAIGTAAPHLAKKGAPAKVAEILPAIGCLLSVYASLSALIH